MNLNGCEMSWFEPLKDESSTQTPRYVQVSSPRIVDHTSNQPSKCSWSQTSSSATSSSRGSRPNSASTPRYKKSVSITTPQDSSTSRVYTSSKTLIRHNSSVRSQKLIGSNHCQKSKFYSLRQELINSGNLYKDTVFPSESTSLYKHSKLNIKNIQWKRPHEIVKHPKFTGTDVYSPDIEPGKLGDTHLLSALTCLSATPHLLQQCIPTDQDFDNQYAGVFHFRFWRFGEWVEVVIDDLLPTVDGHLLYMRSTDPEEFWPSLFEKAYAKLYGSYENIHGGNISWALQDTTGGIASTHDMTESSRHILTVIDLAMTRASLLGAYISPTLTNNKAGVLSNGLMSGHTYRMTGYAEIPVTGGKLVLLRLHNHWHNINWKGAWNQRSAHWKALNERTREKMKFDQLLDGEFWISFNDFRTVFTEMEVCHLGPESWKMEPNLQHRGVWAASVAHRKWIDGFNAGGCVNPCTMYNNTQFYFEIKRPITVILSLMQKYRQTDDHRKFISCSCLIYKIQKNINTRLCPEFFIENQIYAAARFKRIRENVHTLLLPNGAYLIIPMTEIEGQEARFMLRFYSSGNCDIRELDDKDKVLFTPHSQSTDDKVNLLSRQFRNMAMHKYQEIDAINLQRLLSTNIKDKIPLLCCFAESEIVNFKPLNLSSETCKAAITIFDSNVDGRLHFSEFNSLLSRLLLWQNTFRTFAKRNDNFSSYLLRNALNTVGFLVSNKTLETLIVRFSTNGRISLDQFICILIKLCSVHYTYHPSFGGEWKSTLSELLQKVIYS